MFEYTPCPLEYPSCAGSSAHSLFFYVLPVTVTGDRW